MSETREANYVLVVDDEPQICEMIRMWLTRHGLECLTACDCHQAKALITSHPVKVMIADVCMPGTTGMGLLAYSRTQASSCKVILISGLCDTGRLAEALGLGAYDYLTKPLDMDQLLESVTNAINSGENDFSGHLSQRAARAMEFEEQFRRISLDTVRALVRAVEAKDPYTRLHSEQVTHYATELVDFCGLSVDIESVRVAALLHDVGKIGVPDQILTKPGPLTDEEFSQIKRHPVLGGEILSDIPLFSTETMFVRYHHERWDGRGYPDGLAGEEIPLGARVIHIADSMDAMLMARTYKNAYSLEHVLDEFARGAGTQFDPHLASKATDWCNSFPEKLILPAGVAQECRG